MGYPEYAYTKQPNERFVKTIMNRDRHPLDLYWIVGTPEFFFVSRRYRRNDTTHSIYQVQPYMFTELWEAALPAISQLYRDPSVSPNV